MSQVVFYLEKFGYDGDGNLAYRGGNTRLDAKDEDTDWRVWKYTWETGNCTQIAGPRVGSWAGRAALGW